MKKIGLYVAATILAVCFGAVSAFSCSLIVAGSGYGASFTCTLTGEDEFYCYYDCTCTGSAEACSQLYQLNGFSEV